MKDLGIRGTWRSPLAQPIGPLGSIQRGAFIQYGQATVGNVLNGAQATTAVTFTKMYTDTTYRIYLTFSNAGTGSLIMFAFSRDKTTSGFNILTFNNGGNATGITVDWQAVGY